MRVNPPKFKELGFSSEQIGKIAEYLNITRQAVYQWRVTPHDRVLDIELVTKKPRWKIRPDIYPPSDYKNTKQK